MTLQATTWQTVGPFFHVGMQYLDASDFAPSGTAGERVAIEGQVLDGNGRPVPDAVIEIWQADAGGEYAGATNTPAHIGSSGFTGFGRISTDEEGRFHFTTIRPGRVQGPDGTMQSAHLAVRVMTRGLLNGLVTRLYFPSENLASDPVLQLVPEERRATLIGAAMDGRDGTFLWNIELQGERETVFFDC